MVVCPSCGEENPDKFRLCGFCGTPLHAEPSPAQEERKVVSVLFVDLVGFTARSHDADPEDVRAALQPYHQMLKREIERFGGTVEKFIGDAVMAVFGAPVAHEDDAERAVRAALRITDAIEELNEANPALDLSIRAAVNTGEGLVNLSARPQAGEGMVTGDVVNTASRLQGVAPVNGVVVGEVTYRSTKNVIDLEQLESVSVKGKPEPVPVWRAVSARSRFGSDFVKPSTPLIGRNYELGALKNSFFRATREASVQLVTVTGEPGVGKSRLIAEFFTFVDEQPELVSWRQGRCLPYGEGVTFWALGEIVKAEAGILESDAPEQAEQKLGVSVGAVVEQESDREWMRRRLAPLVGVKSDSTEGVERDEAFTAWRQFLEAVASQNPLVLVVGDLHWGDDALLDFVEHLLDWSASVPLLILCTARPELYERRPGWGGGKRNSTTVGLGPLSEPETAQLISVLLSQAVLPAEIHEALLDRAGGNPLYAEEFVRMLTDRGILRRHGRVLAIDRNADIPLPDSVQALIAARLDTLNPTLKAVLHDASVLGKVFWAAAIAHMSGIDEPDVRQALQDVVRKELVRPARVSSMRQTTEYSFWHLLIRDVSYSQIPRAARATKHRAAAQWIEASTGSRAGDHAEVLVHHYATAMDLLRSTGRLDEVSELEEPLRRYLIQAGDRSAQLDAQRAMLHYRRALALLPPGHADRGRVLLQSGIMGRHLSELDEARGFLEEAIREFRATGDPLQEGVALLRLASILWAQGDTEGTHRLDEQSVSLLEEQPPGAQLAFAYSQAATNAQLRAHPEMTIAWSEKALALAEPLNLVTEQALARSTRGWGRCELGDLEGLDDLRAAVGIGVDHHLGEDALVAYLALGDWLWLIEGPTQGLENHREARTLAERRGIRALAAWIEAEQLWMLYDLGSWDEIVTTANKLVEWSRARGEKQIETMALTYQTWVAAHQGRLEAASATARNLLPDARHIGDHQVLVPALAAGAFVAMAHGELSTAKDLVDELVGVTEGRHGWRARQLPTAVRVLVASGRVDEARTLVAGVEPSATRDRNCLTTSRALVAEAQGRIDEALEQYREAADRWKAYGFLFEQGHAHLGAGRCLLHLQGCEEARASLQEAREIFVRLTARPLVEETDSYLARATALSS